MIMQFDTPIKFSEMNEGHAFILYPYDTHVMKKFSPTTEGETNATGVFEDDPWIHVEPDDMVYPIKRLRAADKETGLDERKSAQAQLDAAEKFINVSLGIDYETLNVLKGISAKLDQIIEGKQ